MQTISLPQDYHYIAPDGSEIRELVSNKSTGLAHCILPAGNTSQAVKHKTVDEIWYIVSGKGRLWRKNSLSETIVDLSPGVSLDIPVDTAFQFKNDGHDDLIFLCITIPRWPGASESMDVEGYWSITF